MLILDVQIAVEEQNTLDSLPSEEQMTSWLGAVLELERTGIDTELTVRIVEPEESQSLNQQYRDKNKPTNVLSFPFELPEGIELPLIGDLVVCADIVSQEAKEQNKTLEAHWAHMLVHGCYHLLGYDHIEESEAQEMENKELLVLAKLGFNDPYQLI